jgi:mannose-6-phosphate isomerase
MAIYRLKNPIQNYPWGSTADIPKLLGVSNPDHKPVAELWLGAHPKAPSAVLKDQGEQSLFDLIEAEPDAVLGADIVERFGPRLPFLLKVLASEKALALQVHPTKDQANVGFEKENARGIPEYRRFESAVRFNHVDGKRTQTVVRRRGSWQSSSCKERPIQMDRRVESTIPGGYRCCKPSVS